MKSNSLKKTFDTSIFKVFIFKNARIEFNKQLGIFFTLLVLISYVLSLLVFQTINKEILLASFISISFEIFLNFLIVSFLFLILKTFKNKIRFLDLIFSYFFIFFMFYFLSNLVSAVSYNLNILIEYLLYFKTIMYFYFLSAFTKFLSDNNKIDIYQIILGILIGIIIIFVFMVGFSLIYLSSYQ